MQEVVARRVDDRGHGRRLIRESIGAKAAASLVDEGELGPWSVTEGSVSEAAASGVDSVAEPKPICCSPGGRAGAGRVKARDYPKCEEVLRPGLSRAG